MGYDFYAFTSSDFEDLVQAIFQKVLGNGSIVYGLGSDGARELSYSGKAFFGSHLEAHDGLWIVQAKFKSRDVHQRDQYSWVKTQFLNEIRKFKSGNYRVPNQYIFVTNCVLTPALESGGRDKMQSIIDMQKDLIPRIYLVAYDDLCKLILNNADVRQAFSHLLHPGDELAAIKKILLENNISKSLVVVEREIRGLPTRQSNTTSLPGPLLLDIDFGTSFSIASVFNRQGSIELVPSVTGEPLLHSTVTFFTNGCYIVGNQALKQLSNSEIITISNIKRELATGRKYTIFGKRYTPESIASLIVKSLKVSAEEFFGFEFKEAVVSKPSNYNVRQTKALHDVFRQAGLSVSRMLDEGSSPSFLFSKVVNEYPILKNSIIFLVIDLGGGTLDLSIQEYEDDILETKAVLGDNFLGGIDYDRAVLEFILKKMRDKYPYVNNLDFDDHLLEAERVKKVLTVSDSCAFVIADYSIGDGNLIDLSVTISRQEFKECTSKLNTKIMQYLTKILKIAEDRTEGQAQLRIDAIMLTGQGAKIFTVREIIDNLFPAIPIIDKYMENAVCLGNAHQAGIMTGTYKAGLLLNVHNTSIAIMGAQNAKKDGVNNRIRIPIAFNSTLNTVLFYLVKASTVIPHEENLLLELKVSKEPGPFYLPIYEFSNSSSQYEKVAEIEIPVLNGQNEIEIGLKIMSNGAISLKVKNGMTQYSETHDIV